MRVAKKAVFDILARCHYNVGIKDIVAIMIGIFKQDDQLCKDFVQGIISDDNGEDLLEVLLDCPDSMARDSVGNLFRYLACRLKMIEHATLLSGE